MCVLLVAHHAHPVYSLVVAANRDEFHERPAAPAAYWPDAPAILGGRDLERGGTWLAIDRHGRFAAVTNIRQGDGPAASPRSRGLLVAEFLRGDETPAAYTAGLAAYAGANLLAADDRELVWWSSATRATKILGPGVYGLSNDRLDSPWPKINRLKHAFDGLRALEGEALTAALLDVLRDADRPADHELPMTGVGIELERVLGSVFIRTPAYGTRCSTVVLREPSGRTVFVERRYAADGEPCGDSRFILREVA